MFKNYGDKNFFECGILVDSEHSDIIFDIIWCMPYCDQEDKYQFAECTVDIDDSWIDQQQIEGFADVKKEDDPVGYAISCISYYGVENFSSPYNGYVHNTGYIKDVLKNRMIASDGLDITW